VDLHLDLASAPGSSLRARLEHSLREAVRSGRLAPEARLPSTRELCTQLGVSRGVVVDAYAQLAAEGYLRTRRGGGTTVARSVAREHGSAPAPASVPSVRYDMTPYRPALGELPRRELATAVARVLRETPDERLGLPDPAGTIQLRTVLASYLGRARGVRASTDRTVITTGMRHGVGLVWQALAASGARRVGVEDPGWKGVRETALAAGLTPVPLPVDDQGVVVDGLETLGLDAVAVAPAHQYPTGAVLSAERRRALLGWAWDHGGVVIEDDYDAEYRYDHQPLGSMQGLAPEHVVYGGSTSKTVAPSLRLGWLVVPVRLLQPVQRVQEVTGAIPPPILQLAFADMIERGELDRHLRRQRRRYQRRREALLAELARVLPGFKVRGAAAGLYIVLELSEHLDEAAVCAAARSRGIALQGRGAGGPALLIGFAGLNAAAVEPAVAALAASIEAAGNRASVISGISAEAA
jgi:GntR family transcriptional regulator/MocR family aminotransferase